MAAKVELNLCESTLESMRCFLCKGYLSYAPIFLLPDNNSMCGRCSPHNKNVLPCTRQLMLETLLKDAVFPCKFAQQGCPARLQFGYTVEHEVACEHRVDELPKPKVEVLAKEEPDLTIAKTGHVIIIDDEDDGDDDQGIGLVRKGPAQMDSRRRFRSRPRNCNKLPSPMDDQEYNNRNYYKHPCRNWDNKRFRGRKGFGRGFGSRRDISYYKQTSRENKVIIKAQTMYVTL